MKNRLPILAIILLVTSAAHAAGLKEETGSVKLRISQEQIERVIQANDVAGVEQLLAAGWDPSEQLRKGERRNSIGLTEPVLVYPLAFAIWYRAYDVARLIGSRAPVESMDLVDQAGAPSWAHLSYPPYWGGWNASNPQQSAKSAELFRILLRARTTRTHQDKQLVVSGYEVWPMRAAERLSFFKDGLITAKDMEGDAGRRVLKAALKQYRLNAAVSEQAAADEIRAIIALGVHPSSLSHDDMFGPKSVFRDSCVKFDTRPSTTNNYCEAFASHEQRGFVDARAVQLMLDAGWKPTQKVLDDFWTHHWLRRGESIIDIGKCGFRTESALLVLPLTYEGPGYKKSAESDFSRESDLLVMQSIRPSKSVISKFKGNIEKYRRKMEGKNQCLPSPVCPPVEATQCGAIFKAAGGVL